MSSLLRVNWLFQFLGLESMDDCGFDVLECEYVESFLIDIDINI